MVRRICGWYDGMMVWEDGFVCYAYILYTDGSICLRGGRGSVIFVSFNKLTENANTSEGIGKPWPWLLCPQILLETAISGLTLMAFGNIHLSKPPR